MEQYTGKTVKESRKHLFKNVTLVLHTIYIYIYIYIYMYIYVTMKNIILNNNKKREK
jgi:hypothetical protein